MNDFELPVFCNAVHKFKEFLSHEGRNTDLVWIFQEDVVEMWPRTYIKFPPPENEPLVERLYQKGIERGLGIRLEAFCFLDGRPCCSIWLPNDAQDASYAMLSGLCMSVPTPPDRRVVIQVNTKLHWFWLRVRLILYRLRKRNPIWSDYIPRRADIRINGQ